MEIESNDGGEDIVPLVVQVEDEQGNGYRARTNRLLGEAGKEKVRVDFRQFEPTTKRVSETLNPEKIVQVNIGLGPHYSAAGQKIFFTAENLNWFSLR